MNSITRKIRKYKSRIPLDELYIHIIEEVYYKIFINDIHCYYFFNTINFERVIKYAFNTYFITWENVQDFTVNLVEVLIDKFTFIRCDENEPYRFKEYMILNNFHAKQSRLFNTILESKPEYQNLVRELVEVRLQDYIIDVNFIYTILHPESVLYQYIEEYLYDEVLDKMVDYMIINKIAYKIENVITNDILLPVSIFNFPLNLDFYLESTISEKDRLLKSNIRNDVSMVLSAFLNGWDILTDIYRKNQFSDSYIDDLLVNDKYMEYDQVLFKK